jgi:hypothetical protein
MPMACALIPREDLRPEELEALGTAVERWYWQEFADHGVALWMDYLSLTALRAGELPHLVSLRRTEGAGNGGPPDPDELTSLIAGLLGACPDLGNKPGVLFTVRGESAASSTRAVASLRTCIPTELVKDVLIAGRSWTATD